MAFAYQHDVIVVVRSDDEHLKGISIFSHAALRRDPPECYHLVMPGQHNSADELKQFRQLTIGGDGDGDGDGEDKGLKYLHTPLEYVSTNHPTHGIAVPNTISRVVFKNVVETAVQVSGHEGVWHEGVFMILAAGTRMEDVTVAAKTGQMVDEFVKAGHSFGLEEVDVKLKGQLQDLMGWGDIIVVDHDGAVVGLARVCIPPKVESPLTVGPTQTQTPTRTSTSTLILTLGRVAADSRLQLRHQVRRVPQVRPPARVRDGGACGL